MLGLQGGPKEEVYTCEFLEQGGAATQLVTSASRSLFLWDLASGKCIQSCLPPEFAQGRATQKPLSYTTFSPMSTGNWGVNISGYGSVLQV